MSIEITIIYSPESVQITQHTYTFPDDGGTLGRANNNFWVLEDPNKYMSSVHAKIECQSGQYFLTDTSTNGTFINGASEPVGNGNQVLLNDGDHFTISDYEFVANLNKASASSSPFSTTSDNASFASLTNNSDPFADIANDTNDVFGKSNMFSDNIGEDPFSDFPAMINNSDPFAPAVKSLKTDNGMPSVQAEAQTDPLALLNEVGGAPFDSFATANNISDTFSSNNFANNDFSESIATENNGLMNDAINWPVASPESSLIPDDWDDWDNDLGFDNNTPIAKNTSYQDTRSNFPLEQEKNAFKPRDGVPVDNLFPQQVLPGDYNDNISPTSDHSTLDDLFGSSLTSSDISPFEAPQGLPEKKSTDNVDAFFSVDENLSAVSSVKTTESSPEVAIGNKRTEAEYITLEQQNQQLAHQVAELKLQLANASKITASPSVNVDKANILNMVVDAMGLSKWNLSDSKKIEINETVGLLIRETMQGMMQVLKFRKKIKEEFRINVTTIQSVENNPLKFSANIDDALENMFIKENNAYKKPVDAVREGFQGIAEHQVAVVAGMQAAFRGMIERFDPEHLESRFEKYKSTGLLSLGKKTKRWNAYKEYHQGLVDNLDDSFQHLFGYDFVQAYEEQMNSLISSRLTADIDTENTN
ncbi:type VI secretion system-associated FHA domain protein TagH [Psychromonas sp. Urea-02u-13]|uniref:type VI secretion system-associated FHA domain protein TagH n=1 Tax=Psychromonas sp. Urea-02u-13 TaxID=2058326 RepID=UPI000C3489E5|nr:type VI secretion system-associated FHA domain protein TagH [Psychromonas sp. Urea-02u-13]PKG38772.1 type VI secretion system-associated FHA domain protein TagH [Psychromonas sp. Urea-02u-13]